jgi:predicted dehydrogenase
MSKLRFGICGLGCMGRNHFRRVQQHPQAQVVAVCDNDERRRLGDWNDALGNLDAVTTDGGRVSMAGIQAYATPEELVRDPNVDVVLVALPTPLHAPIAVAALEQGKHVLTEKPMAYRPGECNQMIAAAEAAGKTLMVAQCIRFWPQYELIKQYVDEGQIGRVRFAVLRRLGSPPTYSMGDWLLDGRQSGGAILDLHVHDIDFAQHLLGMPHTVYAQGVPGATGGINHIVATYGYPDGRYAVIEGGWAFAAPRPFEMGIAVHGERGTLEWNSLRGDDVQYYSGGKEVQALPCRGDAYERELDYFIECVRNGRPVERCSPASTRNSISLAWLERRSVELNRQLNVNERLREAWGD